MERTSSRKNRQHQGPRRARDAPQLSSSSSSARPKPLKKAPDEILPDDIVIMLIGRVGSGRSTFINTILPDTFEKMGVSDHQTCTLEATHTIIDLASLRDSERLGIHARRRLVLVDTPGLDAERRSDSSVFQDLSNWSRQWIPEGGCKGGVVVLHDISGNPNQVLRGSDIEALARHFAVVVGTTKWKYLCGSNGDDIHERLVKMWKPLKPHQFYKLKEESNRWAPIEAVLIEAERRMKVDFRKIFDGMVPGKRQEEVEHDAKRQEVEKEVKEGLGTTIANMFRKLFGRPPKKRNSNKK